MVGGLCSTLGMLSASAQLLLDIFFKDFISLFMRDTQREAETQTEREVGSMQGARHGARSQDPGITP